MRQVTQLAEYRMLRQKPATDLLRWHEALESITLTNLRLLSNMQRCWFRLFVR